MDNLTIWNKLKQPPVAYLKPIEAGRLKGKSDINPQWRIQSMTEIFGICGIGWKFEIVRVWAEPAPEGQMFAFAEVKVYINTQESNGWSAPIPAMGGNMLIDKERGGLYANDEAYKMAITDALGTAMRMLGVAADVYLQNFDGAKYINRTLSGTTPESTITEAQAENIRKFLTETGTDLGKFLAYVKVGAIAEIPESKYAQAITQLKAKKAAIK